MRKKKQESPFTGRWQIVSLDEWDVDDMEEEGPASEGPASLPGGICGDNETPTGSAWSGRP
jgi:hypothetical protein